MNWREHHVMVIATMPSTVDVFLAEQLRGLQDAGCKVTVVTSPDDRLGRLREPGIDWVPLLIPRTLGFSLLRAWLGLFHLFRNRRPDLIHTHTPIAAFLGQVAAWLARVPSRVTTVHGLYFVGETRRIPRFVFRVLEIMACRLATKVVCVSAEDARYLVEQHGFPASKVATMHVGVNLAVYSPQTIGADQRQAVREELGIPADAFVFGTVGRLVREKGVLELLEAFGRLARRHANVYLLHVGPEDRTRPDAITPAEAQRQGCAGVCRFAGHRYDVPRYLSAMDVFCLPTYREGYPVSVMEAAAMGLPAIVTDIRGCREAVVREETGLIVPVRDVASLKQAMQRLLDSPQQRRAMSQQATQHAREHFDRRLVVQQMLGLYSSELETAGRMSHGRIL